MRINWKLIGNFGNFVDSMFEKNPVNKKVMTVVFVLSIILSVGIPA